MTLDPRIVRLAGEAAEAASNCDPRYSIMVETDRATKAAVLTITGVVEDEARLFEAQAYLSLANLDELLRELLAARADLLKLNAKP